MFIDTNDFSVPANVVGSWDDDNPLDLFALDLFTAERSAQKTSCVNSTPSWHASLSRVSSAEVNLIHKLGKVGSKVGVIGALALRQALAQLAHLEPEDVALTASEILALTEDTFAHQIDSSNQVYISLDVAGSEAKIGIALDAKFCSEIVDLVLGGDGSSGGDLSNSLSATELAVAEFVCLAAVRKLTEIGDRPLLRVSAVENRQPHWLVELRESVRHAHCIVQNVVVQVGRKSLGRVQVILPDEAVNVICQAVERSDRDSRLKDITHLLPGLPTALILGESDVFAADITQLECGDLLIVERSFFRHAGDQLRGRGGVRLASCRDASILGHLTNTSERANQLFSEAGGGSKLELRIEEFRRPGNQTEVKRMELKSLAERPEETPEEAAAVSLDGLMITVRVELAARMLRLDEVGMLRAGQILELGCAATDLVSLSVEGHRIARGELVDIEGHLGVRLTQVLGA